MSSRGWLVVNPERESPTLISESARYIPLLWLSLLSSDECDSHDGLFQIDRKSAVERGLHFLSFLVEVFPDIPVFEEAANEYLARLKRIRSKSIGIDITELLWEEVRTRPTIRCAVEAIESHDLNYTVSLPAYYDYDFTTIKQRMRKKKFPAREITAKEILLDAALLKPGNSMVMPPDIADLEDELMRELVTGYIWKR